MNISKAFAIGFSAIGFLFFALSFGLDSLSGYTWMFFLGTFVALSFVANSPLIRVAFATVTLITITFFITEFISRTSFGNKSIDLTEDDRYTLTEGTRSILTELTEPVTINYYVTRDVDGTPSAFSRHIPRVDSFLRQIESLAANDLVTLNFIDPKPNTDEEDAALLDQVQQVPVTQDDKLIFGASISSLDKKTVIPFFEPTQETQLEYQVISAIAEVSRRETPVVGIMSALPLATGGQSRQGWYFYQLLQRSYDVANLGMMPTASLEAAYEKRDWGTAPGYLDPEKIPVILVIHPAGITPEAEFTLDQYLLRGGTVIACVDPFSVPAAQSGQSQVPGMPPQGGVPTASTLPKLFEKHNVAFTGSEMVIDRVYADPRMALRLLATKEAMTLKDDISLSEINTIAFLAAGGFSGANGKNMGAGLEVRHLIESSYKYSLVDEATLRSPDAQNRLRFALQSRRQGDSRKTYVALLSGTFGTAFPEGDPSKKKDDKEEKKEADDEAVPSVEVLAEGKGRGNLYLICDTDFLSDGIAYAPHRFIRGVVEPRDGNGAFIFNILDQASGSKYLIGARARGEVYKPFTVLKEKEAEFEKIRGEELEKLRKKRQDAEKEIQRITSELARNNNAQRSAQVQAEVAKYNKEIVDANKQMRDEQKSYQADIDSLKADIFWRNILYMPLGVIAIGLGVFVWRKKQTTAR